MSYFDDLLKKPLPSTDNSYLENGEDDFGLDNQDFDPLAGGYDEGECGEEECGGGLDEGGDDGILADILNAGEEPGDDLPDEFDEPGEDGEDDSNIDSDLADLEREINVNGSLPGDIEDDEDNYIPTSVDDPTPAKPVKGQEDDDADKMLAICATPALLDNSLTVQEAVEFVESGEGEIVVASGLMLESDLSEMVSEIYDDSGDFTESVKFASPGKKYMMTKQARLKQLFELSLQIEARAHHDPYYPKIQKAYKIERTIKAGWRKRYGSLAMKRAKKYLKALMMSKSPKMQKIGKSLTKK